MTMKHNYGLAASNKSQITGALKKNKIFAVLSKEELAEVIPLFIQLDFSNGEYIFMEGDPSEWLYIVMKNRVKTIKHTQSGKDIILEINSPGEILSCVTVFNNKPYTESAQAKGLVSVIRIRRRDFLKVISDHPLLTIEMAGYLNEKLTDAYDMVKNISTEIVEKRIISALLKYSEKTGKERSGYRKIDFALTRQEIAEMVVTTVETCIRMMSKFRKQGVVKYAGNRIYVKAEPFEKALSAY
jgi:CRP/FNR family transcriptional regulator